MIQHIPLIAYHRYLELNRIPRASGVNSTFIQGTETTSSTVGIAQAVELNSEDLSHTLVLKDRLEGAHLLSMVAIDDDSLTHIGTYLAQMQSKLSEANSLDSSSPEYGIKVSEIKIIENEMSAFLGALLFHKNELDVELRSGG